MSSFLRASRSRLRPIKNKKAPMLEVRDASLRVCRSDPCHALRRRLRPETCGSESSGPPARRVSGGQYRRRFQALLSTVDEFSSPVVWYQRNTTPGADFQRINSGASFSQARSGFDWPGPSTKQSRPWYGAQGAATPAVCGSRNAPSRSMGLSMLNQSL